MPTDRSEYLKAYRQSYKTRHKRVTVVYTADEFKKIEADAKSAQMSIKKEFGKFGLVENREIEEPVKHMPNDEPMKFWIVVCRK